MPACAAALIAIALAVAGAIAAFALPSSIYPPLEFPRIVVIAKSGTLPSQSMTVTVTRPLEQAVMEVPGIRRVRSRTIRGATEISAQFDAATDMVVALQQVQGRVAEIRGELPADTVLTVERLTPAVFPVLILSMTGAVPTADLSDLATYVVKPDLARVPGAGRIDVLASDTREVQYLSQQVVLVGYGRVGRRVAEALAAHRVPFVVAEQNRGIVQQLRAQGHAAVYGDAAQPETLVQAHIARARLLVIATPESLGVRQMAAHARMLNPGVQVVVRSHNEDEAQRLEAEVVGKVFLGEHELAEAMSRYVLAQFGR